MKKLQRILLVGGHPMLIAGLRWLLAEAPDIEVLAESDGARGTLPGVAGLEPQLLLIDTSISGVGDTDAIAAIRQRFPQARLLMVVAQKSGKIIRACVRAGANGCVRRDATHEEFLAAIRSVAQGDSCLDVEVSADATNAYADARPFRAGRDPDALTPRERDVLRLVAAGKSSRVIAEMLALSVKTVGKHRANLMAKLDLHNAAGLTAYAIERGLHLKTCRTPPD